MGVPSDVAMLAKSGILSASAGSPACRWTRSFRQRCVTTDVSVAAYIRARMGAEVVERLIEPLLGGVYAGTAERLSLDATMPQIAIAAQIRAVAARRGTGDRRRSRPRTPGPSSPPCEEGWAACRRRWPPPRAPRSGPGSWSASCSRTEQRLAAGDRAGARAGDHRGRRGDRRRSGPRGEPPARRRGAPGRRRAGQDRVRQHGHRHPRLPARRRSPQPPTGSGYLVPPVEGRPVKAVTFSSVKWPHLAETDPTWCCVRCSIGRIGEERVLQRDDAELVALAMAEMAEVMGVRGLPGRHPGHPLGRRPAAVRRRPPRPGRPHPRGRRRAAGPGGVRGRLRRPRHPRLHRHRPHGGRPDSGPPGSARENGRNELTGDDADGDRAAQGT